MNQVNARTSTLSKSPFRASVLMFLRATYYGPLELILKVDGIIRIDNLCGNCLIMGDGREAGWVSGI